MKNPREELKRIFALARHAPAPPSDPGEMPLGFATRVAASWAELQPRQTFADRCERLCWFGMAAAMLVCLAVVGRYWWQPEPGVFELVLDIPQRAPGLF